ncbi:TPA: flagellar hook-basal body complex protein [Clostridioides difficile]|uniref:Flagellar hook protein FlgE n=6 Tax=Clostridioides difficile TaxID=1496 RepID=Q18CZ4_CLOD6|nr:flagellar hook-basal body complex protein [Clostridioides difficile]EQF88779.1 flagellar hook-basal body family protein [Clostridioides difficile CD196]EQF97779.1 flagellar hook-basal body family protein [Clostridioides difficile 824]OFU11108.1 flagellar biosynthesis protein FlgC [Clostridium sp. HMSC19D02]OFU43405.1 flagellar biosynthesis protein FlgC [Clostridium sp. HMSC19A11]AJP09951.1 flagellar hook protein FlgE (Distal rod protein) [Clostridioides difficile 630]
MIKAMYSGVSGMKANQTKLDVIGNNVANAGTTSFKKSSARITDSFYQTVLYASAPTAALGGTNLGQVGVGSKISSINKDMVQGNVQPTNRPSDLMIDGDGYLPVVRQGTVMYTRDGSFNLDTGFKAADGALKNIKGGRLVNGDGYMLQGMIYDGEYKADTGEFVKKGDAKGKEPIVIPLQSISPKDGTVQNVLEYNISKDGTVEFLLSDGQRTQFVYDIPDGAKVGDTPAGIDKLKGTIQKVQIYAFQNPAGLDAAGGNLFKPSANSGDPQIAGATGTIIQGAIEASNVDIAEEFTEMIIASRSFQANSKIISTSDEILQEIINLKR